MYISQETAQLILDAIAWLNDDWIARKDIEWSDGLKIEIARDYFVKFCRARGIEGVEVIK